MNGDPGANRDAPRERSDEANGSDDGANGSDDEANGSDDEANGSGDEANGSGDEANGSDDEANGSGDDGPASDGGDTGRPRSAAQNGRSRPSDGVARILRLTTHALQLSLVGFAVYAAVGTGVGLAINVGLPLVIALFPEYLRRRTDVRLHPLLELWIVAAAVLHVGGTLGAYQALGWYDQLAHAVSGALIAGLGYGFVRAIDDQYASVEIPVNLRFVFILVFTLAIGALWEVGEFGLSRAANVLGGDPLLTQYGLDDVVLDLVFDAAGAVLVAAWGTHYFVGVRAAIASRVDGDEHAGSG